MSGHPLSAADFPAWFDAVHGVEPFDWQRRLVTEILAEGRWPELLDLPTGSGKTAAIDIALFTLACAPQVLPRRIVYVVDRRIIVSQSAERAALLMAALAAADSEITRAVADRLRALTAREAVVPLRFAELRGGIALDETWTKGPDVPALLVSTVDQVGSRILFRGYGVPSRMRPIHAGLLGNDCLFLLDEVHLSAAFAQTLHALGQDRLATVRTIPRRWQLVEMSATASDRRRRTFALNASDLHPTTSPVLSRRVDVSKQATLRRVGRPAMCPEDVLGQTLPGTARTIPGHTIGVVVNRVETARRVAAGIRDTEPDATVHLLTGRMRPLDRQDAWDRMRPMVQAGRVRENGAARVYLVATQTIEAGADLDLDGLVTEIAPLDALRQRFGRVDRRGDLAAAGDRSKIIIVAAAAQTASAYDDAIYGTALTATWAALQARHGSDPFDVGPLADAIMFEGTDEPALQALSAPASEAPLLLRHHLELLAQTHPEPAASPEISYWLHGPQTPRPEVSLVWRADVTDWHLDEDEDAVSSRAAPLLMACPPRTSEALAVPLAAARRWLQTAGAAEDAPPVADVESSHTSSDVDAEPDSADALRGRVLRWTGSDSQAIATRELRPGDTIVVPCDWGGLTEGVWDPGGETIVTDLGDRAQHARAVEFANQRPVLRLHDAVLRSNGLLGQARPPGPPEDDTAAALRLRADADVIDEWLAEALASQDAHDGAGPANWVREVVAHLRRGRRSVTTVPIGPATAQYVLTGLPIPTAQRGAASTADLDWDCDGHDETHSFGGRAVALAPHCEGVGDLAARYATACGLGSLAGDLRLAGRLHDLGKADPRFQVWLHDGDEIAATRSPALLAKSGNPGRDRAARDAARRQSGYPSGQRHELLSLALATSDAAVLADARDPDLVLHLIATHHGFCRIMSPQQPDPEPRQVTIDHDGMVLEASSAHGLDSLDSGIIDRHERLIERYGWHGVAYLESLLRLADHRRSALEEVGR